MHRPVSQAWAVQKWSARVHCWKGETVESAVARQCRLHCIWASAEWAPGSALLAAGVQGKKPRGPVRVTARPSVLLHSLPPSRRQTAPQLSSLSCRSPLLPGLVGPLCSGAPPPGEEGSRSSSFLSSVAFIMSGSSLIQFVRSFDSSDSFSSWSSSSSPASDSSEDSEKGSSKLLDPPPLRVFFVGAAT